MKRSTRADASKQNAKRVEELEQEKKCLQKEVEELRQKFGSTSITCKGRSTRVEEEYLGKLNDLELQALELRKKLGQSQLSKHTQKSDEAAKKLQEEISRIKSQKVELQRKMKKESVQLRSWKALREKEVLQLRKDSRKAEYEMKKLLELNQRLKLVLRRKTEEAFITTKWLKELLKSRKAPAGSKNANGLRFQEIEKQVEVRKLLNEVRFQCEREAGERVRMAEEAAKLKEEADMQIQKNLWCLVQDKETECKEKDSEILELNEKLNQMHTLIEKTKVPQAFPISLSGGSNIDIKEDTVRSASEHFSSDLAHTDIRKSGKAPVSKSSKDCSSKHLIASESEDSGFTTANSDSTESEKRPTLKHSLHTRNSFINETKLTESENSSYNTAQSDTIESGKEPEDSSSQSNRRCSDEQILHTSGQMVKEACCSCGKRSLCKTSKCQCRASGGACGISCGCASKRCTNRETILVNEFKSSQVESAGVSTHDEMRLQTAEIEKPADWNEDCIAKPKPLADIGNTEVIANAAKPNRRKK